VDRGGAHGVSEGVDIPRLRLGVYATTTTTELFFRQAVGRFVRWTRACPARRRTSSSPTTCATGPGPPRSPTPASQPAPSAERDGASAERGALDALVHPDDRGEQLSMFAALSAVVTARPSRPCSTPTRQCSTTSTAQEDDAALEVARRLPARPAGRRNRQRERERRQSPRERSELRERNARLVQDLVWANRARSPRRSTAS
jgi:superfamily II DNA or RNA helicase